MIVLPAAPQIRVDAEDRQQAETVDVAHLVELLTRTLTHECDYRDAEVGLAFVTAHEIAGLNAEYMDGSGPTDVLAFPIDGVVEHLLPGDQPVMLGDIVVCPEVASHAPQSLADELALLVVHGALHLLGHDHAEPAETVRMKAREADLLLRFHA